MQLGSFNLNSLSFVEDFPKATVGVLNHRYKQEVLLWTVQVLIQL